MRISDWSSDVCSSDLLRIRRLPGLIQGRNLERFALARFEINDVRWRIDDTNLGRRHLVATSMIFEPKGSDELKYVDEWKRIARGYKRQTEHHDTKGPLSRLRESIDRRSLPPHKGTEDV